MKKYLKLFVCILAFFPCLSLRALDFGLIMDQNAGYSISLGETIDGMIDYSGALIPRFSSLVGDNGSIFISASAKASGSADADFKNNNLRIIPELLRSDFSYSFGKGEFRFGRMQYQDPLGFIAAGLFDGVNVSYDAGDGSVRVGAWYTGLLYKERQIITMTRRDMAVYASLLDYSDFQDTYFAPRHALAALEYEHQGLFEKAQLRFALLGQFDIVGGKREKLHSQYAAVKLSAPSGSFVFDIGGTLEMMEYAAFYNKGKAVPDDYISGTSDTVKYKTKTKFAMAGLLGVSYLFSASRISLSGVYSSGVADNGSFTAFLPLTTVYQGDVLNAKLSGLSVISLDYLGRLRRTFSVSLAASCFIRTDLGTYSYPFTAEIKDDGYIVGTEFFGRLWWNPVSDVQLNFGLGAFMPSLGNMVVATIPVLRAEIGLVLTLY